MLSTLLSQLQIRIDMYRHIYPHKVTFHKHLGTDRDSELKFLFGKDIVFTTFATAATDFKRGQSPLSKVHWFRIVLDEGKKGSLLPICPPLTL